MRFVSDKKSNLLRVLSNLPAAIFTVDQGSQALQSADSTGRSACFHFKEFRFINYIVCLFIGHVYSWYLQTHMLQKKRPFQWFLLRSSQENLFRTSKGSIDIPSLT